MKPPLSIIACLASILLAGCSEVVHAQRTTITPSSITPNSARVASRIETFLTDRGYKKIPLQYYVETAQGVAYRPIEAFGKFRGGEFRVYEGDSSLLLVSWYGYIPPFSFDSPQFLAVREELKGALALSHDISLKNVTYDH